MQPVSIHSDIRVVLHVRQTPQYKLNIKVTNKPHVYYEVITMGKSDDPPNIYTEKIEDTMK